MSSIITLLTACHRKGNPGRAWWSLQVGEVDRKVQGDQVTEVYKEEYGENELHIDLQKVPLITWQKIEEH